MAEGPTRVQLGFCGSARAKVTRCGLFRVSIIGGQDLKVTEQRPARERRFTVRCCHPSFLAERRNCVDYCLLEKSNISKASRTCSGRKPAVHDSERPISLPQRGTAKYGTKRHCLSPFERLDHKQSRTLPSCDRLRLSAEKHHPQFSVNVWNARASSYLQTDIQ